MRAVPLLLLLAPCRWPSSAAFLLASPYLHQRQGLSPRSVVGGALHAQGRGKTPNYSWVESDGELEVRVELPPGTPARDVEYSLTKSSVKIGLKGKSSALVQGQLKGAVAIDGSFWTIDEEKDGSRALFLRLEKVAYEEGMGWRGVVKGEDPESTVLDYDEFDNEADFDVEAYMKELKESGFTYDESKVDKTMFQGISDEFGKRATKFADKLANAMETEEGGAGGVEVENLESESDEAREELLKDMIDAGVLVDVSDFEGSDEDDVIEGLR
jgi:hypothetical protein